MEVLILFLALIAGSANGLMDTLQFHYSISPFYKYKDQTWWNPRSSWKNKYKDREKDFGPAFFGSTTFLVWTTDAWHFFQMIFISTLFLAIVFYTPILNSWILDFILLRMMFWFGFKLTYKNNR